MPLPESLRQEFATLQKSFLDFAGIVGSGYHLANPDPTLQSRARGQGLKLYDKVEEDCRAAAVIRQYKLEVVSREWKLKAASDDEPDQRARDLVKAQLENLGVWDYPLAREYGAQGFDGAALNFLDADFKGYACGEVMWHQDGGEVVAAEVRHRDQRRFGFATGDQGYELRLLTRSNQSQGEPLPPQKIIYHSPSARDSNPYGVGYDSRLFWPVFFKRQDIQFWLVFADKFGSPTPVGKYPAGTSAEDKGVLIDALKSITQGMVTSIPDGMVIEFLEAMRSGSVQTYEGLCRYLDEQMAELVLGQTGTTNQSGGGGSRARDEVARTGMTAVTRAASDILARTLDRTLIRWIVELNRPILGELARPPHLFWEFEDPEDLNQLAERDNIIFGWGYRPSPEYIEDTYGSGYVEAMPVGDGESTEGLDPVAATGDVQATALNGAQISSLVEVVQGVTRQELPLESAIQILQVAFPTIDETEARQMLTPAQAFAPPMNLSDPLPTSPQPSPSQGEGAGLLSPQGTDPSEGSVPLEEFAEADPALPPTEYARELTNQARTTLGPTIDGWVDQIRELMESIDEDAPDAFDQFAEGLIELYPRLSKDDFAEAMQYGLLAAHLGGAGEVQTEAEASD